MKNIYITNFMTYYQNELIKAYIKLDSNNIIKIAKVINFSKVHRNKIFVFGNGGSAAIASHFSHNLNWDACADAPVHEKFRAIALNEQTCHLTGIGNDRHYDQIFVEQVKTYADKGDILIGVSASGNSENVIEAIKYGNSNDMTTITLTGSGGGIVGKMGKINLIIGSGDQQVVEDVQQSVCHMLVRIVHYMAKFINNKEPVEKFPDIAHLRLKWAYLMSRNQLHSFTEIGNQAIQLETAH